MPGMEPWSAGAGAGAAPWFMEPWSIAAGWDQAAGAARAEARTQASRRPVGRFFRVIVYSTTTALNMPASMWYSRWQW
ncbi:hypothetical protein ADE_33930 [Achromobacter denitrificans]|nr:hypothetical protein ADE_33930 [Achromobacter denitrificans]